MVSRFTDYHQYMKHLSVRNKFVNKWIVILVLGYFFGTSLVLLGFSLLNSRPVQDELRVIHRQQELNKFIQNRGATLTFGDIPSLAAGDNFIIPVVLGSPMFHVIAADIEISYDPQFLEVISIENGDILDSVVSDIINTHDQKIIFSLVLSPTKTGFVGSGIVANINARALKPGRTTLEYIFTKNDRNDTNVSSSDVPGEDVLESVKKLQLTIQ